MRVRRSVAEVGIGMALTSLTKIAGGRGSQLGQRVLAGGVLGDELEEGNECGVWK